MLMSAFNARRQQKLHAIQTDVQGNLLQIVFLFRQCVKKTDLECCNKTQDSEATQTLLSVLWQTLEHAFLFPFAHEIIDRE